MSAANTPRDADPAAHAGQGATALIIGASGAIGSALANALQASGHYAQVLRASRNGPLPVDITEEASVSALAARIAGESHPLRLIVNAAGVLHDGDLQPEKSWRQLDPTHMARSFAINATGPALLMKHLLPLLPREGRSVFATLSARVGSIGDNHLGGWYAYRASKAALNQLVRTAAIELRRQAPAALCVALHPGTVASALSAPFTGPQHAARPAAIAAAELLTVIERLPPEASGGFYDYRGDPVPW